MANQQNTCFSQVWDDTDSADSRGRRRDGSCWRLRCWGWTCTARPPRSEPRHPSEAGRAPERPTRKRIHWLWFSLKLNLSLMWFNNLTCLEEEFPDAFSWQRQKGNSWFPSKSLKASIPHHHVSVSLQRNQIVLNDQQTFFRLQWIWIWANLWFWEIWTPLSPPWSLLGGELKDRWWTYRQRNFNFKEVAGFSELYGAYLVTFGCRFWEV